MNIQITEFAIQRRSDPVGYLERALLNDGDQVPPHIRKRLEARIREHRSRNAPAPTLSPGGGAAVAALSPEQARVKALTADLY